MHENIIDNITLGRIAPSKLHGFGLFAVRDIPLGTVLATLDGQKVAWDLYRTEQNRTEHYVRRMECAFANIAFCKAISNKIFVH